jgi:phosphate:Na+ symporter
MHFSLTLLNLAGATMLLLFAVQMVRTAIECGYGDTLRTMLGAARRGRIKAAAGGATMAVMLQSSTAVAMLACGFRGEWRSRPADRARSSAWRGPWLGAGGPNSLL